MVFAVSQPDIGFLVNAAWQEAESPAHPIMDHDQSRQAFVLQTSSQNTGVLLRHLRDFRTGDKPGLMLLSAAFLHQPEHLRD